MTKSCPPHCNVRESSGTSSHVMFIERWVDKCNWNSIQYYHIDSLRQPTNQPTNHRFKSNPVNPWQSGDSGIRTAKASPESVAPSMGPDLVRPARSYFSLSGPIPAIRAPSFVSRIQYGCVRVSSTQRSEKGLGGPRVPEKTSFRRCSNQQDDPIRRPSRIQLNEVNVRTRFWQIVFGQTVKYFEHL